MKHGVSGLIKLVCGTYSSTMNCSLGYTNPLPPLSATLHIVTSVVFLDMHSSLFSNIFSLDMSVVLGNRYVMCVLSTTSFEFSFADRWRENSTSLLYCSARLAHCQTCSHRYCFWEQSMSFTETLTLIRGQSTRLAHATCIIKHRSVLVLRRNLTILQVCIIWNTIISLGQTKLILCCSG
jgi:hypothetical protein